MLEVYLDISHYPPTPLSARRKTWLYCYKLFTGSARVRYIVPTHPVICKEEDLAELLQAIHWFHSRQIHRFYARPAIRSNMMLLLS